MISILTVRLRILRVLLRDYTWAGDVGGVSGGAESPCADFGSDWGSELTSELTGLSETDCERPADRTSEDQKSHLDLALRAVRLKVANPGIILVCDPLPHGEHG